MHKTLHFFVEISNFLCASFTDPSQWTPVPRSPTRPSAHFCQLALCVKCCLSWCLKVERQCIGIAEVLLMHPYIWHYVSHHKISRQLTGAILACRLKAARSWSCILSVTLTRWLQVGLIKSDRSWTEPHLQGVRQKNLKLLAIVTHFTYILLATEITTPY